MADAETRTERPRLQLKPRDPDAAKKLEIDRLHSAGKKVGARQRRLQQEGPLPNEIISTCCSLHQPAT
jgi:hypothetical protein